jgi:acetyltransferase-like isoleucine patch superfamily enzyme
LTIHDGVQVTDGVKILTHGHDFTGNKDESLIVPKSNRVFLSELVIEENVFIGSRAIIMPGVNRIGKNAIIGAGSVVTKEVLPNVVVAGNPAKVINEFSENNRYNNK